MKKSSIFLALLLLVTFMPTSYSFNNNGNQDDYEFDHLSNEGYIAYVVNSWEPKDNKPVNKECECKGTGTITHGDGHKTPCPYVNPETGKCEFGKLKEDDVSVKKNSITPPFPKLTLEQMSKMLMMEN